MSGFVVEILSEEIPSRFHHFALEQCVAIMQKEFQKHGIIADMLQIYISPCRIVFEADQVKMGKVESRRGPSVDANLKAVEGFAKSCGVEISKLDKKKIGDTDYYFSPSGGIEADIKDLLCKAIERSLSQISWPKSMFWNDNKVRWVRPIRNIMAIFEGSILPIEFCNVKANNYSYGHKFMSPERFGVENFQQYQEELLSRKVILSSKERKSMIAEQISLIIKDLEIDVVHNEALLDEIVGLVEFSVVQYGKIDKQFLSLPKEVIIKIMSSHQKFIATQYKDQNLSPYFITVLNVDFKDSEKEIIEGNEKVLRARLCDGKFFFEEDTRVKLESRIDNLKQVVFHDKLGTLFEKVKRMELLSLFLSSGTQVDKKILSRAVLLAKADLTTLMVNEFSELQGTIGKYYAQHDGEDENVIAAIYEHYLPIGKDSDCPKSSYGALISIADKMDTIVGLFLANEIPTSSKDPYALRRCALGIIRVICSFSLDLNLKDLIKHSVSLYNIKFNENICNKILEFIYERFRYWLKLNAKDDLVSAVLHIKSGNICEEYKVLKLLENILSNNKTLFFTFKRVINVVESNIKQDLEIKKEFLNPIENKLLNEIIVLEKAIKSFYDSNNSANLVAVCISIEEIVNDLFKDTIILDKNLEIQKHRISVLHKLYCEFKKIADFSLIDL